MTSNENALAVLWRRRLSFLVGFAVTLAAVAVVTFSLPKVYSSSAYLWVNPNKTVGSDFEATQLSQVLTKTYAELLQHPNVANRVAARLPFHMTGRQLEGDVEVSPIQQSELLQIKAEASSPARAQTIANTYAQVFRENSVAFTARGATASRVTVAEPASRENSATRPKPKLYLLIGAVIAAMAGAGLAMLRQRLDQRIELDESTTEVLGLPVLGRIPRAPREVLQPFSRAQRSRDAATTSVDEAFRLLLANLSFVSEGARPGTIAVVSADEREGKSTCAMNLARAAMEMGLEVLLVDADLRRASLSRQLEGVSPQGSGLSHFLARAGLLDKQLVQLPDQPVTLVLAGLTPPNPSALLGSKALDEFDRQVKYRFDLVVYDTPPLSIGADASLVAARTEGVLFVVDSRRTKRSDAVQAIDQLQRAKANVLGVVLNRASDRVHGYYTDDEPRETLDVNGDAEAIAAQAGDSREKAPATESA